MQKLLTGFVIFQPVSVWTGCSFHPSTLQLSLLATVSFIMENKKALLFSPFSFFFYGYFLQHNKHYTTIFCLIFVIYEEKNPEHFAPHP